MIAGLLGKCRRRRSGVPAEGGARVAPRFHVRRAGGGDLPGSCTVNESSCMVPPG
ncbi:hypothetical protein [Actinoplanes sp. NPDC051494]|uniref:hypothetical protein n=1 Tax=Actinoplanes sp. NPDC051494 TaxID=3363907 RepID=UPI003795B2E4